MIYYPAWRTDTAESVFTDKCDSPERAAELARVVLRMEPKAELGYGYYCAEQKKIVCVFPSDTAGAFQVGKTYTTRSICNHDSIIEIKVLKRTAKTIVADTGRMRGVKRLRIAEYDGVETVKPWGSYSMAPQIAAK